MYKRLKQLENNISQLEELGQSYSVEDIKNDKKKEWALRYGFLESIQIIIDISCHLVVQHNLGNAETYADCIELLNRFNFIDDNLRENLKAMTGLRNILVHEYVAVDIDHLYSLLERLGDFESFAKEIKEYIT